MNRERFAGSGRWTVPGGGRVVVFLVVCIALLAVATAGTVTAQDRSGELTVEIVSTNAPVEAGTNVSIGAEVTNDGSADGSQEIELAIEGSVTDSVSVALEPGESQTVELTWDTAGADPGTYNASVSSDDDVAGTEVRVEKQGGAGEPESIRVLTQPQNTTVGEPIPGPPTVEVRDGAGDPLPEVTVEVNAVEEGALTGENTLVTNAEGRATFDDLEMERGVNRKLVFNASDPPIGTVSEAFAVVDETPPSAALTRSGSGGRVAVGSSVEFDASESSDNVEIVEYSWEFGDGTTIEGEDLVQSTHEYEETGEYEVAVTVVDDSGNTATARTTVEVDEVCSSEGTCTVEITETNSPVTLGDRGAHNVEINATVRVDDGDIGGLPGNQTVTLSVAGEVRDSTDVPLEAGAARALTLAWADPGPAGEYAAVVFAGSASDSRQVRLREENSPPTVRVFRFVPCNPDCDGDPIIATVNDSTPELEPGQAYRITSDASDRDGSIVAYEWRVDGEVVGTTRTFDYAFPEPGEYNVELTATDDDGASVTESVSVPVAAGPVNRPPTVGPLAFVPCTPECAGNPVFAASNDSLEMESITIAYDRMDRAELIAPETTDPDGAIEGYEWRVDGEVVDTARTFDYAFPEPGEYTVELTATDDDGATAADSVTLELAASTDGSPPTTGPIGFVPCDPDCDGDPVFAESNETTTTESITVAYDRMKRVELIAPEATDPDGAIEGYAWTVDGEFAGDDPEQPYTFPEPGEYTVELVVRGADGDIATESVILELTDATANSPPTTGPIGFVPCTPECAGDPVFAASNDSLETESITIVYDRMDRAELIAPEASDPDGAIEGYEWRVDGEPVSTTRTFDYAFPEPGEYTVELTATDDDGATAAESVTLELTESTDGSSPTTGPLGFVPCEPDCDGDPVFAESNETTTTESITIAFDRMDRVELIAPEASDPDGAIEGYAWTVDGELAGDDPEQPYTFPEPGEYTVELVVRDADGDIATESVTLELTESTDGSPPTTGPITVVPCDPDCAGNPVIASSNETESITIAHDQMLRAIDEGGWLFGDERVATLSAPEASDPDGTVAGYAWTVNGEYAGDGSEQPYTFPEPGEYIIELVVRDDDGATATESVTLELTESTDGSSPTVGPLGFVPCDPDCDGEPVFAAANDSIAHPSMTVAFDRMKRVELIAPEASDPDGAIEGYAWTVDGEFAGDDPEQPYTFPEPGEYTVELVVRDADGEIATEAIRGVLTAEPAVSFTTSPTPPITGQPATFEASVPSSDSAERDLRYEWEFGDDSTASGQTVENTYETPGNQTVTLSVTDENDETTTIERVIEVRASGEDDPDLEGEVSIGGLDSSVEVGEERELTVEADTADAGGSIASYEWTVDGEPAGNSEPLTYTFDSEGEHRVAVTITDENGSSTTVERTLTVEQSGEDDSDDGLGGVVPVLVGLVGAGLLLAGGGYYYYRRRRSSSVESSGTDPDSDDHGETDAESGGATNAGADDGRGGGGDRADRHGRPDPPNAGADDGGGTQHDEIDTEDK